MLNNQTVCGIIGGLGPSATADLYQLIIKNTNAHKDQDHLRILIDSNPQIPDRTAAILNGGQSSAPRMIESAKLLENAGADYLAVPCNTAHYFIPEVQKAINIPFINMIEETAKIIKSRGYTKAGLLSTSGTAKTGIYQNTLSQLSIETIVPSEQNIAKEMEAIYGDEGIKAGKDFEKSAHNKNLFIEVIAELKAQGAQCIIMGCTEIPLCLESVDSSLPLINPTEVLAKAIILRSKK